MNDSQLQALRTGNYKSFIRAGGDPSKLTDPEYYKNMGGTVKCSDCGGYVWPMFLIFAMIILAVIVVCYLSSVGQCKREKFGERIDI